MPDSTMPSNVPAPPMESMPVETRMMSFKCNKSAPINGPATPAVKATGGADRGVLFGHQHQAHVAPMATAGDRKPGITMPTLFTGRATR